MKHEWRKKEKQFYLPKTKPEVVKIPEFNFLTISGNGNPNNSQFSNHIGALYPICYGIKMSLKKNPVLKNYIDYTVYPLEGIWDISDEAKQRYSETTKLNKNDLVYTLMIRQPNFITEEYVLKTIDSVKTKKLNPLFDKVKFTKIKEGKCIQMLHIGSYDNELETFKIMEDFARNNGLQRVSKTHREIYLSDFRRVPTEKLKTVLRFNIKLIKFYNSSFKLYNSVLDFILEDKSPTSLYYQKLRMMNRILFLLLTVCQLSISAQTTISGKVTDKKNNPILGASVYLDGTYDGSSTDEKGEFSFKTEEKGNQTLVVSFVSYETFVKMDDVTSFNNLKIKLRDDVNTLDAVTINAGTFRAGEKAKVTVLKPLDIVTTASAVGDVLGALQTLPGTSANAEDGRLFVRGGDAEETQIFIDGVRVFTPYSPTPNNAPTRGRYSPFLFKGITFSTGGYSAEYGQALSSVLDLTTVDKPDQEKTDISFMTVGLGVGNTQMWKNSSLSINTSYINLQPYTELFPDRNTWLSPYQSGSGEAVYRYSFKDESMVKIYGAFSYTDLDVIQDDINFEDGFRFGLENRNLYINSTYKNKFGNNWKIETGMSFTNDKSTVKVEDDVINNTENSAHFKVKFKKQFTSRFRISFGSEYFITKFDENYKPINNQSFDYGFNNNLFASFAETDIFFSKNLASKIGVRAEHSDVFNEFTISPRVSLSYKSGENSQFSLAYGQFYQNPSNNYLKFNQDFRAENTSHLIANFQHTQKNQIFRIEAYYKDYNDLVKFDTQLPNFTSNFSNNGSAYAKGIDVFWRQNGKIKNTDYWISYSFLDTERDFRNYPTAATPNFASTHNFSFVAKHWVEEWKSQLGIAYNFASGRTYTNPNESGFLNHKTKPFNSVSLNWAYLIDQQKILYLSVNNALGTRNVFGYNYANTPDNNGNFDRQAIVPNADSFFFVGFFWTISDDKKSNQLDNL